MRTKYFHIINGKLSNPSVIYDVFKHLPDGRYELKVNKKNRRSLDQNAYYWGVVVNMVQEGLKDLGHDISAQDTHEFLKARFNSKEIINDQTGEVVSVPMSTTELTKEQFGQYIEKIQRFAAEFLNIVIPNPNEQTVLDYEPIKH